LVLVSLQLLLVTDVPPDLVFVQTDGTHAIPSCPETPPEQRSFRAQQFRYPIAIATLYRGGTLNSMWMWSGIALPSTNSMSLPAEAILAPGWIERASLYFDLTEKALGLSQQ
jgi:hypothetical protein